jgi:hypothetical protein
MVKVITAGKPTALQVNQPRSRQRRLHLGQLPGTVDAQQVTQHAAARIKIRIRAP